MPDPICPKCYAKFCYAHCSKSPDGEHQVNPTSAKSPDGEDNGRILVDFNCIFCAQPGSALVSKSEIYWE